MALCLPHGPEDPLRQPVLSQNTDVRPGVGPDGFDHGGAFADALCILWRILCRRLPGDDDHAKHEQQQQGLHDRALSKGYTFYGPVTLRCSGTRPLSESMI